MRDIPLSYARKQLTVEKRRQHLIVFNHKRAGVSLRPFRQFFEWNADNVSLVSHLLFDGELKRSSCIYNNRSVALTSQVRNCMKRIYDYEPKEWLNGESGVMRISYHNVSLAAYMQGKAQQLLHEIAILPKELQRSFLCAFFDDEGCIYFRPRKNTRLVRGYQYKLHILRLVQHLLKNFSIESKLQIQYNEITISRRENIERFAKEINFSNGVTINGSRSNSA